MSDKQYNCPECKDTGIYQGLNAVEPCRACSPGVPVPEQFVELLREPVVYGARFALNPTPSPERFEAGLKRAMEFVDRFVTSIHLTATPISLVEFESDYRSIDHGYRIEHVPTGYRTVHLSRVISESSNSRVMAVSFADGRRVSIVLHLPNGKETSIVGRIKSYVRNLETQEADITIEQGPADA